MTQFKGTKGKWVFHEFNHSKLILRFSIKSNNGGTVCKMLRDDNDDPIEEKANAILIIKAPEMLEMLEGLYDMLRQGALPNPNEIAEIKQLIKEATEL